MTLNNKNVHNLQTLLWKDFILLFDLEFLKRILFSIVWILFLILLPFVLPFYFTEARIYTESVSIDNLDLFTETPFAPDPKNDVQLHLAYSPNTSPVFEEIVKAAATSLSLEYSGYANSRVLETALKRENYLTGIEFDDSLAHITKYPKELSYKLRFPNLLRKYDEQWHTEQHFPQELNPRNPNDIDGGSPIGYLREGFLPVQNAISTAFIIQVAKDKAPTLPKIVMQRYPRAATTTVITYIQNFLGFFFFFTYFEICMLMVQLIVQEKEKQLKEVMKIFGVQSRVQWMAWFVIGFIIMSFLTIGLVTALVIEWKNDAHIMYACTSLIVFFFLAYSVSILAVFFLGTTFFSRTVPALFVMEIFGYIILLPYLPLHFNYNQASLGLKLLLCLLPNVALCTGTKIIFTKESSGEGWHWSNIFKEASADDSLSLGLVIIMMLVSCVLYMGLCLYLEQIFPSEFGVPQKWNFPFKKTFWTGKHEYNHDHDDVSPIIRRENPDAFEKEPLNVKIAVRVINLSKIYNYHLVVNNVSLNLYEGEITVLLGHNGAGKTTMISMLIGMITSTSGTAIINGYDIRKDLAGARMSLSICPQHNILYDDLTVEQHLIFYGRLKGLQGHLLEAEVQTYMKKSNLEKKAHTKSSKLSGGMKRKLSVCAAFCGGTKVVLLDEPSAGLDPAARRDLWNLIISEKHGRTILLTTHFMDEAEVLGDRIAILSGGQLQCFGTPFFLKKKFGSGYNLICEKKTNCDSTEVTKFLDKYIPGIQPKTDIGSELSYQLPDSYTSKFKVMLQDLESNSNRLNLEGYGISITSLEDVFLKMGTDNLEKVDSKTIRNIFLDNQDRVKGSTLLVNQWRAMIRKKFLHGIRNKVMLCCHILGPIFVGILIWIVTHTKVIATGGQLKPLPLDLLQFPETVTVLETKSNVKDESLEAKISNSYKEIVESLGPDHVLVETDNQNFLDYMLDLVNTNQKLIDNKYIAAATVDEGKITAWLNNYPFHTAPITLNLIHNAMARSIIGPSASIYVSNYPLPPISVRSSSTKPLDDKGIYSTAVTVILYFVVLYFPIFVLLPCKEKQNRFKLLQCVGGVRTITFWMSHFVNDFLTYTISVLIILVSLYCIQVDGLATFDELGRIGFIMILNSCALLPLMYSFAYSSKDMSSAYTSALMVLLIGRFSYDLSGIMININTDWFLLNPMYSLQSAMMQIKYNSDLRELCRTMKEEGLKPYIDCRVTNFFALEKPGVLREMLSFVLFSIFMFSYLFFKDSHFLSIMWDWMIQSEENREPKVRSDDAYFDEDVEREKEIVDHLLPSKRAEKQLVLDRLTKFYGKFLAVNEISLIVSNLECFGLLGVNGAGKTSTFKMLTGDETISSGQAYVKGLSLIKSMNKVYEEIGYCPQFDALLNELTGRETLEMYCMIRGIPEKRISQLSKELAIVFGFMKYYNQQLHSYSGGNKRKLSVAISVIGTPSLIYLDEPTTGMDPAARRHLWNVVCKFRDSGKSIILTSHSMDECEALCTRLAIMVNGEFRCLGSIQHLKNRFTKGLTLKIKVRQEANVMRKSIQKQPNQTTIQIADDMREDIERIIKFIEHSFPESQLKHEVNGLLSFNIPLTKITWSQIFGLIEANKDNLNIEDYSITQTTLEDIFLQFSENQLFDL